MTIDAQDSLGDLAIEDPRRTQVFSDLGLDYCCNGQQSLREAVAAEGLDLEKVLTALNIPGSPPATAAGPQSNPNGALAHDIVDTHHAYMWQEMPRLQELVHKVAQVHAEAHPELAQVKDTFDLALNELEPHMTTEERVVFPAISRMEKAQQPAQDSSFEPQIQQLRDEHEVVGSLFSKLCDLTSGYVVPEDACTSYTLMLQGLAHMERDLHEHIHKENNVLFPRVLELEKALRS